MEELVNVVRDVDPKAAEDLERAEALGIPWAEVLKLLLEGGLAALRKRLEKV